MKGFQYEDIGLFTFYRQQAEYQQRKQAEKRQREQNKRTRKEQEYRIRKQKQMQQKQKNKNKEVNSMPSVPIPKLNYIQKAKKYIKQIELYGHNKLMHSYRKKQRKMNKQTQSPQKQPKCKQLSKQQEQQSIIEEIQQQDYKSKLKGSSSEQIFVNKRDVAKVGYYQLLNKEALAIKQFNSIEIFQINNPPETYRFLQMEQFVKKKAALTQQKQPKTNREKLPRISHQINSVGSSLSLPKKQKKKQRNHYNPIDVILNNQRYQIHQLQKSKRIHGKQQQSVLKMDMINQNTQKETSVLNMIKRFRMIK